MTQPLDWRTDTVRFSFLGCTDEAVEALTWMNLTGVEPESVTSKKSLGTRNEEGPWGSGLLTVAAQSGRVDVIFTPVQPQTMPKEPPHLGALLSIADQLRGCILRLKLPRSARLAIGAQISVLVEDSKTSLELLNKLTPYVDFKPTFIDVCVQYNSVKKLKHGGAELNRLYKWTQAKIQFLQIAVGPDGRQIGMDAGQSAQHILQLELDFNTAPHSSLPHADAQRAIVIEMFDQLNLEGNPQVTK
ncbi:hypothetical protein CXB37_04200 [Pseudomonas syringae pv. syringae]|nr:hypothetical protein CCL24_08680 [Pseudomonas congelans]POP79315.1 hypothetical protein CXB37_04200 [Pseudomonas syringae pv. syringae]